MRLSFTEDEMAEFLLARGHVLCQRRRTVEENVYQNVFAKRSTVVETVFVDGRELGLREAFERVMKKELIYGLWKR